MYNYINLIFNEIYSYDIVLQKAGNHMEHTFLASYVCLLIGNLIMECKQYEVEVRQILRNQSFVDMVQILEKYYNFLNLTASVSFFYYYYDNLCIYTYINHTVFMFYVLYKTNTYS